MSHLYNVIPDDRNTSTAERSWTAPLDISPGSNTYKLVSALLSEADRIDADLEAIYEAQHINSAGGDDLDKLGRLVNVTRKSSESDDKYRARIKAEFRQGTIGTTFDQFAEFCAAVLDANPRDFEFLLSLSGDPATVDVGIGAETLEGIGFTESEIQEILDGGVPAGHEVQVFQNGTFRLKSLGDTDDPDKGLTSDSVSTGGTLAEDLVSE